MMKNQKNLLFYFEDRGINNHIIAVRKAISLGIELNRTVVILPFGDGHIKKITMFLKYTEILQQICAIK